MFKLCNTNQVSVQFFPSYFQVRDLKTGVQLLQGHSKDELYEWPTSFPKTFHTITSNNKTTTIDWHARLGHPSPSILKSIISEFSLPVSDSISQTLCCRDCLLNKSQKLPFSQTTISSTHPLQYLFTDLWISPILSIDNYKYYLVIVDHYSRYVWLFPLKLKSQVRETFIRFTNLVENRFQRKIGTLFSDNGGEFLPLRDFLSSKGISHLTSPPHNPEHNGLAERRHRHIVETGLILLSRASIPNTYWSYAFAAAVYLINRMPTPTLSLKSPYQTLFQTTPNYNKLRIFGCLCFPWLRPYVNHKLEPRSKPCVLLGYSLTQSAYICLEPTQNRIYISRHVRFDESKFPYQSLILPNNSTTTETAFVPIITTIPLPLVDAQPSATPPLQSGPSGSASSPMNNDQIQMSDQSSPAISIIPQESSSSSSQLSPSSTSSGSTESTHQLQPGPTTQNQEAQVTNPTQIQPVINPNQETTNTQPQNQFQPGSTTTQNQETQITNPTQTQPVTNPNQETANNQPQNQHRMQTRLKNHITKPNKRYALTAAKPNFIDIEPRTHHQALKEKHWRDSMSKEYDSQIALRTWDLVPPSPSQNVIDTKWIYRIKLLADGTLDKYKSRFVARGFKQQQGIDFQETFSPVIKSTTTRIILKVAVSNDWCLRQLDINNAFLQGTLNEEVYVKQPPGFVDPDRPDYVCKLRKALYGLKQAPRAWYMELKGYLVSLGFKNSLADTSLFILQHDKLLVYVLVYVDDIIITGNNTKAVEEVIRNLATRFSVKDMGNLSYFLGIEAVRTKTGLHLNQRKYIHDLLGKHDMQDAKAVATPMASSPRLTRSSTEAEYRSIANTASEVRWVCSLISEMGIPTTNTPVIYCDNIGATYLCANPVFHTRMKHLALDYHYIREQVQAGQLQIAHISTHDQLADGLTKPLTRSQFTATRHKIGVSQAPPS